jgi:hypothetical protein
MLHKPSLQVRETAVYRGKFEAYRARFHNGINILSGENSSGKSTILSLIIYGLGADISNWSEHARLCERVSVEVLLNGNPLTLSRLISPQAGQPMEVFPGPLAEAEMAPATHWNRYPYRTSGAKESFSQALFNLLNIPELETETSGKLTIHQLLRVMYSDQLSGVERIFRDDAFDSPILRDAVGRLLFGAYEADIYVNQLKIRFFEKELATIESALRSIFTILSGSENSLTLDWAIAERARITQEQHQVQADITAAEEVLYSGTGEDLISLEPQRKAFQEAQRAQRELARIDDERASLELEQADSQIFIRTLEEKVRALQESSSVADIVSEVHYSWCPSCFAPLEPVANSHACHLCKQPFDEGRLKRRIVSQLNDMLIQLKQSKALQNFRMEEIRRLEGDREKSVLIWNNARSKLSGLKKRPTSEARDHIRILNERSGYLARELEALTEKEALLRRLDEMSSRKSELGAAISKLVDKNEALKHSEADRLARAFTQVANETIRFLHRDLPRQDSFQNAKSVTFNFARDAISVDGQSYFSASSTVYLKNSFLSALLFAAASNDQFRHLRFLVLDTIEDKGMEPERSQNFQRLLAERSAEIKADHQIIFATAMIAPELDNPKYVVGVRSTHDRRTLALQ